MEKSISHIWVKFIITVIIIRDDNFLDFILFYLQWMFLVLYDLDHHNACGFHVNVFSDAILITIVRGTNGRAENMFRLRTVLELYELCIIFELAHISRCFMLNFHLINIFQE